MTAADPVEQIQAQVRILATIRDMLDREEAHLRELAVVALTDASVTVVATAAQVSRPTIYAWLRDAQTGNREAAR